MLPGRQTQGSPYVVQQVATVHTSPKGMRNDRVQTKPRVTV